MTSNTVYDANRKRQQIYVIVRTTSILRGRWTLKTSSEVDKKKNIKQSNKC